MEQIWDALIVGGGPAGLTAATYLRRYLRSCLVLDDGQSRARYIPESQNCPGFPHGISGTDLLARMREQAGSFGAEFHEGRARSISGDGEGFVAIVGDRQFRASAILLASGVRDRLPDVDWVEEAIQCGAMRLCAVCDAYEAQDQTIGVYGALDDILPHAEFLRAYSSTVVLIPTKDSQRPIDEARLRGFAILPAGGELSFDGEKCAYRTDAASHAFDTFYPFLGCDTAGSLLGELGAEMTETGELRVDKHQQTTLERVYAIGDVASGLNQISVAVGHAAVAATHLHNRLPQRLREQTTW